MSAAITLPAASTTGHVIVVSLDYANRSRTVRPSTDSKGNTYSRVLGPSDFGTNFDRKYTYYARNVTGGGAAITITVNLAGGTSGRFFEIYATEYQGLDIVDPLDQASDSHRQRQPAGERGGDDHLPGRGPLRLLRDG